MKNRHPHRNIPKDHFEEEQGQGGFYGSVSHLIKKRPSTRWKKIDGPLKPRMFDLVPLVKQKSSWTSLLHNKDLRIHFFQCEVQKNPEQAFRNADGDLMYFCHKGEGVVLTEYGLLSYSESQYICIPKCLTHVFLPSSSSSFFVTESLNGHYKQPSRGLLGRHGLYDSEALQKPDLDKLYRYLDKNNLTLKEIQIKRQKEKTNFIYDDGIFDVTEWKGDLFPYTLSMNDIMPVMSHRVHLPPSVHSTFVAEGFIICSFLPRPLEQDKEALRVPFYHQNTDYDEVLFYHKGDFFSRDNLHANMMSYHPAGFPHGPHPKAIENIKGKTETNEYAVMVDSKNPLLPCKELDSIEIKSYWESWK